MDAQRGQRGENERGREEEISTHHTANQQLHQRSCDSLHSRERERCLQSDLSASQSIVVCRRIHIQSFSFTLHLT